MYSAGFINFLFGMLIFTAIAYWRNSFIFNLASLPTFTLRAFLEIIQTHAMLLAITKTERSTYAIVRNLTIPLLLIVDFLIGFTVSPIQWFGISLIFLVFGSIFLFKIFNLKDVGYPIFTAVNAVATISLFKYNITHFNSVEAEEMLIIAILLIYLFFMAQWKAKENPLVFLKQRIFFGQGFISGIASIFGAFAISFGNPGIAMAAERTASLLAGIISGHSYFQEKHLVHKLLIGSALVFGLFLLAR
ncbi:MAG: hypothetical protein A3I89_02075 [Candidatus Harrisonbacteria bacterium RIFCSPLOWO2_02_FULL_41_11]|nr:MAG: hypothetical protein A3I89_02075 [Candidatus Harrisonbacteria bacterium RIFCSPLOWO2_02_FULL_41_11]